MSILIILNCALNFFVFLSILKYVSRVGFFILKQPVLHDMPIVLACQHAENYGVNAVFRRIKFLHELIDLDSVRIGNSTFDIAFLSSFQSIGFEELNHLCLVLAQGDDRHELKNPEPSKDFHNVHLLAKLFLDRIVHFNNLKAFLVPCFGLDAAAEIWHEEATHSPVCAPEMRLTTKHS